MVDFKLGNEHQLTYGAHLLFETRPMIDSHSGHERYGGPFRYLGRQAIFPTQTFRLLLVLIAQFDVALKEDMGIDLQLICNQL